MFRRPLESRRSAWEAKPGGVANVSGPGVDLQKAPLKSAQETGLHEAGRHVRALVACGNGDRVVHVVSLYGSGDGAERIRQNEQLLRDTVLFLAGLGAVPIMILADLDISPHLSLAVRSATDVDGQTVLRW